MPKNIKLEFDVNSKQTNSLDLYFTFVKDERNADPFCILAKFPESLMT